MSDGELQKMGILFLASGALQLVWGTVLVLWSKPLKGMGGVMLYFGVGFVLVGTLWYFDPFGNEISNHVGVALFAVGGVLGWLRYKRVRGEIGGKPAK